MTNPKKLNRVEKEFPEGKENYCPRCYFEGNRVLLRKDCPHSQPKGGKCPKGCLWPHQPEHWHYKDSPANLPTGQVGHPADEGKEGGMGGKNSRDAGIYNW